MHNPKSTENLQNVAELPKEEHLRMSALGGKHKGENHKKRKCFRELFNERLTPEKASKMADAFINMVLDESVGIKDRRAAFELILKVLGEDGQLKPEEVKRLDQIVHLKID